VCILTDGAPSVVDINDAGNVHAFKRSSEALSRNCCCRGKAIIITYSKCVFAPLINLPAKSMPRTVSSVACSALHVFFSHYLINGTIFMKILTEHTTCFEFLYNFCLARKIQRDIIINLTFR